MHAAEYAQRMAELQRYIDEEANAPMWDSDTGLTVEGVIVFGVMCTVCAVAGCMGGMVAAWMLQRTRRWTR